MGYRLSKQQRQNVRVLSNMIKQLNCDGPKEFSEIAKSLGYELSLDDIPEDFTVNDVIESMNKTQKKVMAYLINEAIDQEQRKHDGGRWNY